MKRLGARFVWMGVWVLAACGGRLEPDHETPEGAAASLGVEGTQAAGGTQAGALPSAALAPNAVCLLPADNEVGGWVSMARGVFAGEKQLSAELGGAAAAYLDRGWKEAALARYVEHGKSIAVGVHDMGSEANAQSYYAYMMPAHRESVPGPGHVVLDLGLPKAYAAAAWVGCFYIEARIDDTSGEGRSAIVAFTGDIVGRYLSKLP